MQFMETNSKTLLMLKDCPFQKTLWLLLVNYTKQWGSPSRALGPFDSIVVIMNTSFISTTSFLD
jgi:hypothetical protein